MLGHAADRVFPVAEALAPPPQCMPCGVCILMATLIAGHGAKGKRRNPGQHDPDAAGVLDLNPAPEMGAGPGSSSGPHPADGHVRERRGGAGRYDQVARAQQDAAAQNLRPLPDITLSDERGQGERALTRRSARSARCDRPAHAVPGTGGSALRGAASRPPSAPAVRDGCLSPSGRDRPTPSGAVTSSGAVCAVEAAAAGKGVVIEVGKPSP